MLYNIAVATGDGIHIDGHFGSAVSFLIINVNNNGTTIRSEERVVSLGLSNTDAEPSTCDSKSCASGCSDTGSSGTNGCGGGHSDKAILEKVTLLSDCRCLLCKKVGPSAQKELEKKAITTFQIDCEIEEALIKIVDYYAKVDNHLSLRKSR